MLPDRETEPPPPWDSVEVDSAPGGREDRIAYRNERPSVPWRKVLLWEALFQLHYGLRSVSLEIWRASQLGLAEFEEMKFGETPLRTVRQILTHLPPLGPQSLIGDLGCGRGRAAFLFHFLTGSRVLAIDAVPSFIATGQRLSRLLDCEEALTFVCDDIRQYPLHQANVLFACALCFGASTRRALLNNLVEGPSGQYLVSVGWRPQHSRLKETAHFRAPFSWGSAWVTVSRLVPPSPENETSGR